MKNISTHQRVLKVAALSVLAAVCLGSSCQNASDKFGKMTGDIAHQSGMSGSDSHKLGQGAEMLVSTANQKWDANDIGESTAVSVTKSPGLVKDQKLTDYVMCVGLTVAAVTGRQDIDFTFGVMDDNASVNAVSAPKGYIFITRGALLKMQDESELAAVLAHEIAHVVEDHGMESLKAGRMGSLVTGAAKIASDNQMVDFLADAANDMKGMVYNPKQETEADKLAVKYLAAAGYDAGALARFMEREMGSAKPDFRSHPPTAARITKLKQASAELPAGRKNGERFLASVPRK